MRRAGWGFLALCTVALGSGCGYTLQNSKNPLADKEGIRRIYVAPIINNSYKVGVENLVYNALLKTLVAHRRVVLVSTVNDSDAILQGTVKYADYAGTSVTSGTAENPLSKGSVYSQYQASLTCSFVLYRPTVPPGKKQNVWTGDFSRSRPFPSAVQQGVRGETTSLINDSEFDRNLGDIAEQMMADVHESMLALF